MTALFCGPKNIADCLTHIVDAQRRCSVLPRLSREPGRISAAQASIDL